MIELKDKDMEVKRLLKEYRGIKKKLRILEEEVMNFETIAEGTTAKLDGQPHGSDVSDKMASFSVKAADARTELKDMISELNRRRWYIIRLATRLTDPKQITIVHGRYIADEEETWTELADSLGLTSTRQAQRIHGEALEELQDAMEREELGHW